MDFLDIEGAAQWGDGSNEKLHCALFSPSLSMKKKKKKTTTKSGNHMSEQKSLDFGGQEPALTLPKRRKGKSCEKQDLGKHEETLVGIHPHKAKRKYFENEEEGGNDQTSFQRHSQKAKRKPIEKERVPVDGKEQTPFQIHSKKAKKDSIGKEGVHVYETSETKGKRKPFDFSDKEEHKYNSKQLRTADTVNEDDESGRNLGRARSIFTEEGQDVEYRKRKKRKRKPRNNKFEGWAKKGISHPSEKLNGVEERSLKVKDEGKKWKDTDEEDNPCEKMMRGGNDWDGKEGLKDDDVFEGFVREKNERILKQMKKRKSGEEDVGPEEQAWDTKTDENFNTDFISEDEANYRNKAAGGISKKQEENLPKYEQNFEDKLQHNESKIIYADKKKGHKAKGEFGGMSSWDKQLRSARFRFINETLYKSSGAEAFKTLKGDRAAFEVYHEGYSQQVQQWPENPVDIIIKYLKKRPPSWIVGDFGCGEAKIAQSVHQKVLSFDIFRANENVTVCNISKVPLRTESLDVAVYCLSLMGSNWPDYLREANRVLKKGGLLKVAEVTSRFKSEDSFVSLLNKLGFTLKGKDLTNKMFYMFDFEKKKSCGQIPDKMASILKPCKYKRR